MAAPPPAKRQRKLAMRFSSSDNEEEQTNLPSSELAEANNRLVRCVYLFPSLASYTERSSSILATAKAIVKKKISYLPTNLLDLLQICDWLVSWNLY